MLVICLAVFLKLSTATVTGRDEVPTTTPIYSTMAMQPEDVLANQHPECGLVYDRENTCAEGFCSIREAKQGHHPWHVAIFQGNSHVYMCSGVLIDRRVVLTTATCVRNVQFSHLRVRLGTSNVRSDGNPSSNWESSVVKVVSHPHFNEYYMQYDVAALRLKRGVDYEKYPHIRPICLSDKSSNFSSNDCYTAGWHMAPIKEIKETVLHDESGISPRLNLLPYSVREGYVVSDEDGLVTRRTYRQMLLESPVRITRQDTCSYLADQSKERFLANGLQSGQGCLVGSDLVNLCVPDVGSALSCMSIQESARRRRDTTDNSADDENPDENEVDDLLNSLTDVTPHLPSAFYQAARAADGITPCTPYPTVRLDQLKAKKKSTKPRGSRFYLAGIVSYVGNCLDDSDDDDDNYDDGSDVRDDEYPLGLVVFTEYQVILDFLRHLIMPDSY